MNQETKLRLEWCEIVGRWRQTLKANQIQLEKKKSGTANTMYFQICVEDSLERILRGY